MSYTLRKVERYTNWEATKPVTLNPEDFKTLSFPFEGETEQEFAQYIHDMYYEDWYELADELEIAPGTVARSYTELERDSLIHGKGRRGTFVANEPPHSEALQERRLRLQEATLRFVYELRQLGISAEEAHAALNENFKSAEDHETLNVEDH